MGKIKKCKQCGSSFEQKYSTLQSVCGTSCAIKFNSKKETKARVKQMRADLKTHKDWVQILQVVFNKYIRLRDRDKNCVSCQKPLGDKYDAGHFFPTTKQVLRFDENNVHAQCVHCNQHLHGNIQMYALNLPKRIGFESFEDLHARAFGKLEITVPEIREKIAYYKLKIKEYEG